MSQMARVINTIKEGDGYLDRSGLRGSQLWTLAALEISWTSNPTGY